MDNFNTVEEVKEYSRKMELAGINFIDKNGNYCRGNLKNCIKVEYLFIDSIKLILTYEDSKQLNDHTFSLRPSKNNS